MKRRILARLPLACGGFHRERSVEYHTTGFGERFDSTLKRQLYPS